MTTTRVASTRASWRSAGWWLAVAASIAVAYAATRLMPPGSGPTSYLRTAVYLQFFVCGIVLARYRTAVIDRVRAATTASRVAPGAP